MANFWAVTMNMAVHATHTAIFAMSLDLQPHSTPTLVYVTILAMSAERQLKEAIILM